MTIAMEAGALLPQDGRLAGIADINYERRQVSIYPGMQASGTADQPGTIGVEVIFCTLRFTVYSRYELYKCSANYFFL